MRYPHVLSPTPRALPRLSLAALLCFALLYCASAFGQYDPGKAREQYNICKASLNANEPCDALIACEQGLAAMDIASMRSLTDQARGACVQAKQGEREQRRKARPCDDGKARNPQGQCCWEGQQTVNGACAGVPSRCPDGWLLDVPGQVCAQTPCPNGQVHADEQHCCWPSQVWLEARDRCIGIPSCPDGLRADAEACVPVIPDQDIDGIADASDLCPTIAEDKDSFQDDDGCPDPDNDADGICDALFASMTSSDASSAVDIACQGADGCPDSPEDIDGFQDGDGCPDLDNDADGFADALDLCPDEPGLASHTGCMPPPDYTFQILGWSGVGVGAALTAAAAGVLISTIDDEDQLNNPSVSLQRADVVLGLTEVEAQTLRDRIDSKQTFSAVSFGVGGALLVGGVVLLILDHFDTSRDLPPVNVGVDTQGNLHLLWTF
jgi:hypothetical protein